MKTIKETLELALEALTETLAMTSHAEILKRKAITALREALTSVPDWASEAIEQPAPVQQSAERGEPVATVTSETGVDIGMSWWHEPALPIGTKLYTSPPTLSLAQRQARSADTWVHATTWRGLTDEQLDDVYFCVEGGSSAIETWREQARAIEARLKEKNT